MFMDRSDFAENFDKLKSGDIPVKAGWRLYSSGPGIYLNQLVSNILGIRFLPDALILDPVLPAALNGLKLKLDCFGKEVTFHYHINSDKNADTNSDRLTVYADETPIAGEEIPNPYRNGGIKIDKNALEKDYSEINIFVRLP